MLLGLNTKKPAATTADTADIFSVSTAEFETKILAESQKRPVLIDFWAPWCGPCKQLMPVLEETVAAQNGKIALAKVNIDDNPELAQAFRVQSVPTVVAFFMGQPVTAFQGVRPKSEIENLLTQLVQMQKQQQPDALDIPAVLKEAAITLAENNLPMTQNLYAAVLAEDPLNAEALAGMLRVLIAAGEIDHANAMSAQFPEQVAKNPHIVSARTALELASQRPAGNIEELERKLASDPQNHQVRFDYAEAVFSAGQKEKAVDALIAIIQKDRGWEDEKARKLLIKYFEAWGAMDPASVAGRRKLSSLLFS